MERKDSRHFFMAFKPPRATKQEHEVSVVIDVKTGKPVPRFHPSESWSRAEDALRAHLEPYRPDEPITAGVVLDTVWCFPSKGHGDGEPYLKRPDTDNLQKGLKDVMTELGWWKDDCIVFSEHVTKIYSKIPGIRIDIEEIPGIRVNIEEIGME